MKHLILFATLILLTVFHAKSENLQWYSWDDGYEIAKQENKPILVFVQADWCHLCQRMNDRTFNNPDVVPLIMADFIPVKFNIESTEKYMLNDSKLEGTELLNAISKKPVQGIPTMLFYSIGTRKADPVVGLKDPDELKELIEKNKKQ